MKKIWTARLNEHYRYFELCEDSGKWAFLKLYKNTVVGVEEVDESALRRLRDVLNEEFKDV